MRLQHRSAFGWPGTSAGYAPCKNGLVVHYDGANKGLAGKSHSACVDYWKWCRRFHMGTRRWQDIGYAYAACPHGYVLEGRGWQREQAAQPGGNTTWTSVTLMSGPSEDPTSTQVNAVRELRAWLRSKGLGAAVRGHRDFVSTTCPGDRLYKLVRNGTFSKAPNEEDDMPLTKADAELVARTLLKLDAVAAPPWKAAEGNEHWTPESYLHWGYIQGNDTQALVKTIAAKLDAQSAVIDKLVDQLAAAQPDLDGLKQEIRTAIEGIKVRLDVEPAAE